jgi:2'-5' RNA ligase
MAQTAIIARVPEAEPYVAHLREQFDPSAKLGVPAHITLLYPFMSPERITKAVIEQVRAVASAASAFAFRLTSVRRFPGVLYLAPDPAAPFIALTKALVHQFPEFPPYGGQHDVVVPHLTVAKGGELALSSAEAELLGALPTGAEVASSCSELVLIENSSGPWHQMHLIALTPATLGDD